MRGHREGLMSNPIESSERADHLEARANLLIMGALFAASIIPMLITPVLPMIDFYNHMARYFVLSHLDQDPFLAANYAANWSMLPNIGMDILGTAIFTVLPKEIAPKIIAIIVIFSIYSGGIAFNRSVTGKFSVPVAILLIPLLYSFILVWGFTNFLFGLGLALWGAAWWLHNRDRPWLAIPVACGIAILIFFAHGVAFALYGLLLGGLEIGLFVASTDRSVSKALKTIASLSVQAVTPALLFGFTSTAGAADGFTNADESLQRLTSTGGLSDRLMELAVYRLQTIVRVAQGPNLAFDVTTFLLTASLLILLIWRRQISAPRIVWPALGLGALLIVVVPPALFGVGYVADRMPLFLALIFISSLQIRRPRAVIDKFAMASLVTLVLVRLTFVGLDWAQYRDRFAEFDAVARAIPKGSLVAGIDISLDERLVTRPRSEMYGPLLVIQYGQAGPLFANATQQPIRLVGKLGEAAAGTPKSLGLKNKDAPEFFSRFIEHAQAAGQYDYILICNAQRLTRPFPRGTAIAARTAQFTLLSLHSAPLR